MTDWKPVSEGVCVVIGAGPGMGRAAAVKFAKAGFKVALLNRKEESTKQAQDEIKAAGGTSKWFACDVTDAAMVKALPARIAEEFKAPVEVLVLNQSAGYTRAELLTVDPAAVLHSFQVHAMGALHAIQAFVPSMVAQKRGTVLITSATAAFRGSVNGTFPMAMAALRMLAQSLAKTHAKDGVHVCSVRLDCVLNTTAGKYGMDPAKAGDTDRIADTYLLLHQQHPNAWTNELDMRPCSETWTF